MNADGEENDEEWEEEEQLVVVHLSGIIDNEYLKKCNAANCKVLGIDTDEPAMQIDRMVFSGSYNESIGTNIIFEENCEMVHGETEKNSKYMCHTTKNLDMIRVFLKNTQNEKNSELGEESGEIKATHGTEEERTQDMIGSQEHSSILE
ncbi:general transcription factor 3C polypeptide 6-like [Dendronephthya gigantea]|uniref:general transcription factor 3C polypeptide 6-like n=1 Tax=Dendronephthya gigantea TaxID=151771 RepID=UPI001069568A|nr:general transcription factor 3C polypeptide 6-like [Dendronephthya gigantea]